MRRNKQILIIQIRGFSWLFFEGERFRDIGREIDFGLILRFY